MKRPLHHFGYCTNVHAGKNLQELLHNLNQFTLPIKKEVRPDSPLGIGLWFSAETAAQLIADPRSLQQLRDWLSRHQLCPFTLNGFPAGNFHQPVVKHHVYQPPWSDPARTEYTIDLMAILDAILPSHLHGTISTVPIGWSGAVSRSAAAESLLTVAKKLHELHDATGRQIQLCLEPEPGCELQRCQDTVDFFHDHLLRGPHRHYAERHIAVCHDVCHTAVMFESQDETLQRYRDANIAVGKVQLSSAIEVPFAELSLSDRTAALQQLKSFAEDRYLHQTVQRQENDRSIRFFDDLSDAVANVDAGTLADQTWRVHFHVPIFLENFGLLRGTQSAIEDCCTWLNADDAIDHVEVETYAWNVLPAELTDLPLAMGIATELNWAADRLIFADSPESNPANGDSDSILLRQSSPPANRFNPKTPNKFTPET